MGAVISIGGAHAAPKALRSSMETLIITQPMVREWKVPPFQRPLRINEKVREAMEDIKKNETIEGVLTLGRLKNDVLYIVDGQHRVEAFKLSELKEAIADVRVCAFDSVSDMADEFVRLNSSLVKMRPDDILRGLEDSTPALRAIRRSCEFVGYDNIRRNGSSPMVSMSALVRCWSAASYETPSSTNSGKSAAGVARDLEQDSIQNLIGFLASAHSAWGRDPENYRLWGNLNLTLCMWLWNRLVIDRDRLGTRRYIVLNIPDFKKCLMAVSADADYLEWLRGRNLNERDRSPCYARLKVIFAHRIRESSSDKKVVLPQPAWSST